VAGSSVVEVWVERLDATLGQDFGWRREPDAIVQPDGKAARVRASAAGKRLGRAKQLVRERAYGTLLEEGLIGTVFVTPTLWSGSVTLPEEPGGPARFRLVIAEFEEYLIDDEPYDPYDETPTKKDRRLVFIEHVELQ